jgi:hypothetical protein
MHCGCRHLVEDVQHAAQLAAAGADGHLNDRELPDEPLHELRNAESAAGVANAKMSPFKIVCSRKLSSACAHVHTDGSSSSCKTPAIQVGYRSLAQLQAGSILAKFYAAVWVLPSATDNVLQTLRAAE